MYAAADVLGRVKRIGPARRCGVALPLTLAASVMMLVAAGPASASYRGRAGAISFEHYSGSIDPNGAQTDNYSLDFVSPPATHIATAERCQATAGDFSGSGEQFCPLFGSFGDGPHYSPDGGPSYSPDGRSVVFSGALYHNDGSRTPHQTGCPGSCEAIFLAGGDGSSPRLVPVAVADAEQPAFMPDGKTLIFAAKTMPGVQYDLYTVATDGTGLERLTNDGASEPAPCANGSVVYVHDRDLYLRAAGGSTRRLTRHGGTLPDCSRDSRTIVFVHDRALYTIYASGRALRRLTPRRIVDGRPAFSPAGGLIAVTTTTTPPGCDAGTGQLTDRLELIDVRGHQRRSYVIDRQDCAVANPETLGTVAWQPRPTTTSWRTSVRQRQSSPVSSELKYAGRAGRRSRTSDLSPVQRRLGQPPVHARTASGHQRGVVPPRTSSASPFVNAVGDTFVFTYCRTQPQSAADARCSHACR
jgi:hypothetical protein